jgi:hypothetical protein
MQSDIVWTLRSEVKGMQSGEINTGRFKIFIGLALRPSVTSLPLR